MRRRRRLLIAADGDRAQVRAVERTLRTRAGAASRRLLVLARRQAA